jgi:hypothetical protein
VGEARFSDREALESGFEQFEFNIKTTCFRDLFRNAVDVQYFGRRIQKG